MALDLNGLAKAIAQNAVYKGFQTAGKPSSVATHVALIHTEVSEIFEAHRDHFLPADFWYEGLDRQKVLTDTDDERNVL